ncbi:MAG: tRNA (adenosine(37)-N6)-threonylcarbamoyltransferase complex ATPase subunit type 1 TsaE [Neisseriaceae bacterium]|nr:MAG: tRNA (adenosine(37)-N6)-threonylcarbamoyltransferase complex ATPase subunit type 1 TsaE [Neisseriaceae bacterium]
MVDYNQNKIILRSEEDTHHLAQEFSLVIRLPLIVYLIGGLGAGKTFFVRSLLQALDFSGNVKSPTYSFLETYHTDIGLINHFDLYRFGYALEWYDLGFDDVVDTHSVNLIEWPEKISGIDLNPDIILNIDCKGLTRYVDIEGYSTRGRELVDQWIVR